MTEREKGSTLLQIQEILTLCFECEQVTDHPELLLVRTPFYFPDGEMLDLTLNAETNVLSDEGETIRWLKSVTYTDIEPLFVSIAYICRDSGLKWIQGDGQIHVSVNIPELMSFVLVLSLACMRVACLADIRMLEYKQMRAKAGQKGSKLDILRIKKGQEASIDRAHQFGVKK